MSVQEGHHVSGQVPVDHGFLGCLTWIIYTGIFLDEASITRAYPRCCGVLVLQAQKLFLADGKMLIHRQPEFHS
jgi:hypothetical protein